MTQIVADQRGIDITLVLKSPAGEDLFRIDSQNEDWGPEVLIFSAPASGAYSLEIVAPPQSAEQGRYRLTIGPSHPSTSKDLSLLSAQAKLITAKQLADRSDPDQRHKAAQIGEEALVIYKSSGTRVGVANAGIFLANLYRQLEEYDAALNHFLDALPLAKLYGGMQCEAKVLQMIGSMYHYLGENARASDYFTDALHIYRHLSNDRETATTLSNLAAAQHSLRRSAQAIQLLNEALTLEHTARDSEGEISTLTNIGAEYYQHGQNRKALEFYRKALALRRSAPNQVAEADILYNIGIASSAAGQHWAALSALAESQQLCRKLFDTRCEADALYGLAKAQLAQGNLLESLSQIRQALALAEVSRDRIAREDLRSSFVGATHHYYELCIDILMTLHKERPSANYETEAFAVSESARARSLLDMLAVSGVGLSRDGGDPKLRDERQRLQGELTEAARQQSLGEKRSVQQRTKLQHHLDELTSEYHQVEAKIVNEQLPSRLSLAVPLGAKNIQEHVLSDDTLLLEYSLGESRSYGWALTTHSIASCDLPDRSTIESTARQVYSLLAAHNRSEALGSVPVQKVSGLYEERAAALSRILLAPFKKEISGARRLVIIADGALQFVPFGALPTPGVGAQHPTSVVTVNSAPLILDHEVAYMPSASAILALRQADTGRHKVEKRIAVFADPVFAQDDIRVTSRRGLASASDLGTKTSGNASTAQLGSKIRSAIRDVNGGTKAYVPRLLFSRREAQTILSLVPNTSSTTALDFDASREALLSADLTQYRILHFATHGILDATHPELSGIVLSLVNKQGEFQDGFLTLADIEGLRLSADLVVLSACETALGKEVRGEGLVGLTQAFMYAGAESVIASLWKVDDIATAELMKRFYTLLFLENVSPSSALRSAQLQMWHEKRRRSPYYWAAFTLQGDWN